MKKNIVSLTLTLLMALVFSDVANAFAPPIAPPCSSGDPEIINIGVGFTYAQGFVTIRETEPFSCVPPPDGCDVRLVIGLTYHYSDASTGEASTVNNRIDRTYTYDAETDSWTGQTANIATTDNVVESSWQGDPISIFNTPPAPGGEAAAYTLIEANVGAFSRCAPTPDFHCVEINVLSAQLKSDEPLLIESFPPYNECLQDLGVMEFGWVSEKFTIWEP